MGKTTRSRYLNPTFQSGECGRWLDWDSPPCCRHDPTFQVMIRWDSIDVLQCIGCCLSCNAFNCTNRLPQHTLGTTLDCLYAIHESKPLCGNEDGPNEVFTSFDVDCWDTKPDHVSNGDSEKRRREKKKGKAHNGICEKITDLNL